MNRALPFIMVVDDLVDGRAFCMENQTLGQKAVEEIINAPGFESVIKLGS